MPLYIHLKDKGNPGVAPNNYAVNVNGSAGGNKIGLTVEASRLNDEKEYCKAFSPSAAIQGIYYGWRRKQLKHQKAPEEVTEKVT